MSSLRQIEANRRNAQKSTGPTSVTGKAVSSMNALKTGIHAKSLVLPSEKLADLEQLIDEYYQSHNPTTPEARSLVDDLIYGEWLKRRLRAAETQIWAYDHQENYRPDPKYPLGQTAANRGKAFAQLQWRIECTRRASRQALQDLQQLQTRSRPSPNPPSVTPTSETISPEIGFVLHTPPSDAPAAPIRPPGPGSPPPASPQANRRLGYSSCDEAITPCCGFGSGNHGFAHRRPLRQCRVPGGPAGYRAARSAQAECGGARRNREPLRSSGPSRSSPTPPKP